MNKLEELSLMVINGKIVCKFDHIATIYMNDRYYFNVFRRYNSDYNILIEDYNGDIYLHQDYTVKESISTILCVETNIYTLEAISYKHNGPVPSVHPDIADMRWTEVHEKYQAVHVNFGEYTVLRSGRKIYKNFIKT